MRTSLSGLVRQTKELMRKSRDPYAEYYAGVLDEVYEHLKDVAAGKHTFAEFAEFYGLEQPEKEKAA